MAGSSEEIADDLIASEARYRGIVEGSLQGIIIQQDDRIVYANPAMATLFGYPDAAAMIGLDPFESLIAETDIADFRERTQRAYAGEHLPPHPGWRARRSDGVELWLSSTAHDTEWRGRPAVTSFYFDITERVRAERASKDSEQRYKSALRAGRAGAWETDFVAGTRLWTDEGQALFGLSLPDGLGQVGGPDDEYCNAIHPDDRHVVAQLHRIADELDSFQAEYRVARPDGTVVWLSGWGQVIRRQPDGRAHILVSIMADVTERKSAELHAAFLRREITHRTKNLLAVIQAIARQTAKSAASLGEFQAKFESRLQGLAASHNVLVRETWRGAPLTDLIRQQLASFVDSRSDRVCLVGEEIQVDAQAAQAIGLALHELATNAMKHGAWSTVGGTVTIAWARESAPDGSPRMRITWTEAGGPPVQPPTRQGFGQVVIDQMISASLDADVTIDFAPAGLIWSISVPCHKCGIGEVDDDRT